MVKVNSVDRDGSWLGKITWIVVTLDNFPKESRETRISIKTGISSSFVFRFVRSYALLF